jgi:hypothetical protein
MLWPWLGLEHTEGALACVVLQLYVTAGSFAIFSFFSFPGNLQEFFLQAICLPLFLSLKK